MIKQLFESLCEWGRTENLISISIPEPASWIEP